MTLTEEIKKIRDGLVALNNKIHEAYDNDDMEACARYQKEFFEYMCKFQQELNIPDEQIEMMRLDFAKGEKLKAEIEYEEAKTARLKGEVGKIEEKEAKDFLETEKRGRIKWN